MRRHSLSTTSNNFGYMYINLFQKDILQTDLQGKEKFMHRVISHYNKLRMVKDISMDGKDKLEKFSQKIQEAENMTWLS